MNIQSSRIIRQQNTQQAQQPPAQPAPPAEETRGARDTVILAGSTALGTAAGTALGYYASGVAGAGLGLLVTSSDAGLGDALVNLARGGIIGAAVGAVAFGAAAGFGAYLAAEHLMQQ